MVQVPRLTSRSVSSIDGSSAALALLFSLPFLPRNWSAKPKLLRELVHDHVIGARLEQRLDHLLAPLDRAVGRRARALALELGGGRQQVAPSLRTIAAIAAVADG
jgi:hypothetical protein